MDSLDFHVHDAALACLARLPAEKNDDDLSVWLEPLSSLDRNDAVISTRQLEAAATLASKLSSSSSLTATSTQAHTAAHARLHQLIERLPSCQTEKTWDVPSQPTHQPPLLDRVSFALVHYALLTHAHLVSGYVRDLVGALAAAHQSQLTYRATTHLAPLFLGARRALSQHAITTLDLDCIDDLLEVALSASHRFAAASTSDSNPAEAEAQSSTDAHYAAALSEHYVSVHATTPLLPMPAFTQAAVLDCSASLLAGSLLPSDQQTHGQLWDRLVDGAQQQTRELKGLRLGPEVFVHMALDAVQTAESAQDPSDPAIESYETMASLAFRNATLIALTQSDRRPDTLVAAIKDALSPTISLDVQLTLFECALLILRPWPAYAQDSIDLARDFLFSRSPALEQPLEDSPRLVRMATRLFAEAIRTYRSDDAIVSAIYSLINLLPVHGGGGGGGGTSVRSGAGTGSYLPSTTTADAHSAEANPAVIDTVVYVVSNLAALHFSHIREVARLSVSMLLQRLRMSMGRPEPAVLDALVLLAGTTVCCTEDEFSDVVKALDETASSSEVLGGEAHGVHVNMVVECQQRLAQAVADSPVRAEILLSDLLGHFVAKCLAASNAIANGKGGSTADLLNIISVVATLLHHSEHLQPATYKDELVTLFREAWFLCTTTPGLAVDNQDMTAEDRSNLGRIAFKTPCLIQGTDDNYIETVLEYDSVLRRQHRGAQKAEERLRKQLGVALPHHAGHLRGITYPQAVFLLTVLRVESLRASQGSIAPLLSYFDNDGVNHSAVGAPLNAVGQQVASKLNDYIQDCVTEHRLPESFAQQIIVLVSYCCRAQSPGRSFAIGCLDNLIAGFPSILCDSAIVTQLLETLTLLQEACESQYLDMYSPTFDFRSNRIDLSLVLPEDLALREHLQSSMLSKVRTWLSASLSRTPIETQSLLQDYIDVTRRMPSGRECELGRSVALDLARMAPAGSRESFLPAWGGWKPDAAFAFVNGFGVRQRFSAVHSSHSGDDAGRKLLQEIAEDLQHPASLDHQKVVNLLFRLGRLIVKDESKLDLTLLPSLVNLPFRLLSQQTVSTAIGVWSWVISQAPKLEAALIWQVQTQWSRTISKRRGFFSSAFNLENPLSAETEYAPTDRDAMAAHRKSVMRSLAPHHCLFDFLSSRFQAARYHSADVVRSFKRLVLRTAKAHKLWSTEPLTRELRMKMAIVSMTLVQGTFLDSAVETHYRDLVYSSTLSWFRLSPTWSYGSNKLQIKLDSNALTNLRRLLHNDRNSSPYRLSAAGLQETLPSSQRLEGMNILLDMFLASELQRLEVWERPLAEGGEYTRHLPNETAINWKALLHAAWEVDAALTTRIFQRFKVPPSLQSDLQSLLLQTPEAAQHVPELVPTLVQAKAPEQALRSLLFWKAVPPVLAISFFLPEHSSQPLLLQYAMRVLEEHPVSRIFFYIPQIVQGLRTDALGYVERFVFEAASISQLFCHQIIWNMRANFFKDDNAEVPDPMKEAFESMSDLIVRSLDGEARDFYGREFGFFSEVTSISKKLQPFIKKTKPEKKAKIDDEMGKIKLDVGVYLPSNPDGAVVDIDRLSGRPLQSHAKAPFMATFKVRKEKQDILEDEDTAMAQVPELPARNKKSFDVWQAAIFKVGDDCRQDLLALQIIAQFKNIFTSYGLDLYLIPYRVTATGPGQGVIDVIPNATSRDEMGRAKVNDLPSFFRSRFGPEASVAFQKARNNFIQSMAAYSVLCYILQIKDRHNGNIMIDGDGHITHIDFGFLFDIGPGGVKFEPNSFKLTHEMVDVMGGPSSPGYAAFKQLTVKAFLACRPFAEEVCATARLMMATDLPSFTGPATIDRLRDRFKPSLSESDAALYMQSVIANAQFSQRSILYDRFQEATNGIPYAS